VFRFALHVYGCQMNVYDADRLRTSLLEKGWEETTEEAAEMVIFITCSIRAKAEQKVWSEIGRLEHLHSSRETPLVAVVGCMAQRLGGAFVSRFPNVRLVAGPRSLGRVPEGLEQVVVGGKPLLFLDDPNDLDDLECAPLRRANHWKAFLTIAHGCDNFCTYCIVPYTRGRERSRDPQDILNEVKDLSAKNYKEVTLLGQNVNSFKWLPGGERKPVRFWDLLEMVAKIDPEMRIRFTTSHPKDMSDKVLHIMAQYPNICKHIHLPVQSGSSRILKLMNRKYDREWYLDRIRAIKTILPGCGLSTDVFTGFCSETEEDHAQTLSLMQEVKFDMAFMFKYSERPGTYAAKKLKDDVPEKTKTRRLNEVIQLQNRHSLDNNQGDIGKTFEVLVEGVSKKSDEELFGRTPQNKVVVFPKQNFEKGDFANVKITKATSATLIGTVKQK